MDGQTQVGFLKSMVFEIGGLIYLLTSLIELRSYPTSNYIL